MDFDYYPAGREDEMLEVVGNARHAQSIKIYEVPEKERGKFLNNPDLYLSEKYKGYMK